MGDASERYRYHKIHASLPWKKQRQTGKPLAPLVVGGGSWTIWCTASPNSWSHKQRKATLLGADTPPTPQNSYADIVQVGQGQTRSLILLCPGCGGSFEGLDHKLIRTSITPTTGTDSTPKRPHDASADPPHARPRHSACAYSYPPPYHENVVAKDERVERFLATAAGASSMR
ncbi:hypothetical protein DXG01_012568 [Tephrocybe rancida]|nr:hypothetical protein DXG01_012568 [Tephrocybe rancida]